MREPTPDPVPPAMASKDAVIYAGRACGTKFDRPYDLFYDELRISLKPRNVKFWEHSIFFQLHVLNKNMFKRTLKIRFSIDISSRCLNILIV